MPSVELLDEGPLRIGSRARIHQPKMRTMIWTVTLLQTGREFTWECNTPGIRSIGGHRITLPVTGGVRLDLTVDLVGPLASAAHAFLGKRKQRYIDLEAAGMVAAARIHSA